MSESKPIIVVSGLPRSGTSMAMQMLQAGGVDILTDAIRPADHDNPRGYFEFELVKKLQSDTQWLDQASGKAVKIIHLLLMDLPVDRLYKVIVLRRDLSQVVRSQSVMLERSGRKGAALAPERLMEIFATQLSTVMAWMAVRPNFEVLELDYANFIAQPQLQAQAINKFLGGQLNQVAMAAAVDPTLHRNKN